VIDRQEEQNMTSETEASVTRSAVDRLRVTLRDFRARLAARPQSRLQRPKVDEAEVLLSAALGSIANDDAGNAKSQVQQAVETLKGLDRKAQGPRARAALADFMRSCSLLGVQ
jgi:hypothetical protein